MRTKEYLDMWFHKGAYKYLNCSFSQEGEDIILSEVFAGRKGKGSYVDIGAYHPIRFSNTYFFYLKGWKGINIDATPGKMVLFNKIRPRDTNLEMGISHKGGVMNFYKFSEGALDTFDETRLPELASCGYSPVEVLQIKTYNIMEIIDEYVHGKDVDIFDVDVEGLDEEIIKDIEWEKFSPKVILTETFDDGNKNMIHKILCSNGYRLIAKTTRTGIYKNEEKMGF